MTGVAKTSFRCAAAAQERGDDPAGTASTVRTFLLVENAGPWGRDAMLDSRLSDLGGEMKSRATTAGVRPLLIRSGRRGTGDLGIRVYAAHARPGHTFLTTTVLESYHQLFELDFGALGRGEQPEGWQSKAGPLFAVCTHGKHDACCAEQGRPVAAAMRAAGVPDAWEVSHIGGDRFAGNMLVLPWGFYYGGLEPENVLRVAQAHQNDRVDLDAMRGRSAYPMPVQYAEIALRRHLDETRIPAVTLRSAQRDGDTVRAVFEHEGTGWLVRVRTSPRGQAQLSCSAMRENPVPVHELVGGIAPVEPR